MKIWPQSSSRKPCKHARWNFKAQAGQTTSFPGSSVFLHWLIQTLHHFLLYSLTSTAARIPSAITLFSLSVWTGEGGRVISWQMIFDLHCFISLFKSHLTVWGVSLGLDLGSSSSSSSSSSFSILPPHPLPHPWPRTTGDAWSRELGTCLHTPHHPLLAPFFPFQPSPFPPLSSLQQI